jgi:hypothetical protein
LFAIQHCRTDITVSRFPNDEHFTAEAFQSFHRHPNAKEDLKKIQFAFSIASPAISVNPHPLDGQQKY